MVSVPCSAIPVLAKPVACVVSRMRSAQRACRLMVSLAGQRPRYFVPASNAPWRVPGCQPVYPPHGAAQLAVRTETHPRSAAPVAPGQAVRHCHLLGSLTGQLCGRRQQRVGIARTLLTSPRLLPLDEPLVPRPQAQTGSTALSGTPAASCRRRLSTSVTHPMKWRAWPIIWCC
jgi:hypothetical protein